MALPWYFRGASMARSSDFDGTSVRHPSYHEIFIRHPWEFGQSTCLVGHGTAGRLVLPWESHEYLRVLAWDSPGTSIGLPFDFHWTSMVMPWDFCGAFMGQSWVLYESHSASHGTSGGPIKSSPCKSHGAC